MIKAIFFDIDGTLVNKHVKALDSTKKAIEMAQAKGIVCGIATGRSPIRLSQQIDDLRLDIFVTYNGQLVYTKDETIREDYFSQKVVEEIVSFSDTHRRQIIFGSRYSIEGSSLMQMGQKKWAKKMIRFMPKRFPIQILKNVMSRFSPHTKTGRYRDLISLNEPIYQCVLLSPESETELLKEALPECDFTRSNPYTVDIIPKGGSKLKGILCCADYLGISLDEIMAFGDSWNDIEMLQGVGVGVAMGNAREDIKAAADYVTKTNEEDGIYHALKQYKILEEESDENR